LKERDMSLVQDLTCPTFAPKEPPRFRGNIPRFYLFTALTEFVLWMPIWVVFFGRRGLSLDQIGALEFVGMGLLAVAEVPTGIIADTWGRKPSMAIGAALHGLVLLGLLAQVLSPIFLLAYAVWGVSFAFISGASDAFVYDSLKGDGMAGDFTRIASRYAMVRQAAGGVAAVAGGLLAAYDMRLCFVLTAVACFAGAGVALTFREPPCSELASTSGTGFRDNLVHGIRLAAGRPRVRSIILIGAMLSLFTMLLTMTALQPFAQEVGAPVWAFGGLLLTIHVSTLGGSYLSPRLAARFKRERLLIVAAAVIAGSQVVLWLGASWQVLVQFAIAGATGAAVQPILSGMLNDAIPSQQRATIISLQSLVTMLGLGVIQLAFFAISQRATAALALGLSGILMALMTAPVLALLSRSGSDATGATALLVGEAA
jgi:MFS family permease